MDYHLKLLALTVIFTVTSALRFDNDSVLEQSEAFFKKYSCYNDDGIDCSYKDIEQIEIPLFLNTGDRIGFSYNKLCTLNQQFFDNGNVIKVIFTKNKLDQILGTTFSNLTAVEDVDLSHNYLWEFDQDTFTSMSYLKTLNLGFNSISMLNSDIFRKSQKLTKLILAKNNFYNLDGNSFEHLTNLEEIDLSGNQLTKLPEDLFRYNLRLRTLLLGGNQFTVIPSDSIGEIPNLYLLDLSGNRFKQLRYPDFSKLSKVTVLRLDGENELKSIGPYTFQGMKRLTYFYASDNKNLRHLDPKAFFDNSTDKPIQLTSFVFKHNSVTQLSKQFLDWSKVKPIALAGNPWNCDCYLNWILEFENVIDDENNVKCSYPLYLRERSVFNLTSNQFKCSFLFSHEFTIIGTILLIITISMIMVVFLYVVVKLLPCSKLRNPFRKSYGYSKVKVSRKGKNYDLEWDPAIGDPQ